MIAPRFLILLALLGSAALLGAEGSWKPAAAQKASDSGGAVTDSVSPSNLGAGISRPNLGGTPSQLESVSAGSSGRSRLNNTQKEQINARGAVENGEAQPLGPLLRKVKGSVPGDVVNVRLRRHAIHGWIYEVTVLNPSGRYVRVSVNARSGTIISKVRR